MASKHEFKQVYFKKPTWCKCCGDFIWGVFNKQGYRCSCEYLLSFIIRKQCKTCCAKIITFSM